jgi:hypothetical protein
VTGKIPGSRFPSPRFLPSIPVQRANAFCLWYSFRLFAVHQITYPRRGSESNGHRRTESTVRPLFSTSHCVKPIRRWFSTKSRLGISCYSWRTGEPGNSSRQSLAECHGHAHLLLSEAAHATLLSLEPNFWAPIRGRICDSRDYDAEVAAALPQVLQKDRLGILERKVDQILARLPLAEPKH